MTQVLEASAAMEALTTNEILYGSTPTGVVTLTAKQAKGVSKFDVVAYTGGDLMVALYDVPAVVDLAGLEASDSWPMLLDHQKDQRVGHTSNVVNDGRQLRHSGHASVPGEHRDRVVEAAQNNYPWQVSIGVMPIEAVRVQKGQKFQANGRTFEGPRIWVKRSKMNETSFVSVGGDMGGATATLTAEARMEAYRKEQAAESERVASIREICATFDAPTIDVNGVATPLEAHAIKTGMDAESVELQAYQVALVKLREGRNKAPSIHTRTPTRDGNLQAIQGALMLRAGVDLESDCFVGRAAHLNGIPSWLTAGINEDSRQQVLESTSRFADSSLMDVAREAVRLDGRDPTGNRKDVLEAAFSGSTLERIFSTSVNAKVLQGYRESPDSSRRWTREVEVNDFRMNEVARLTEGGNELEPLPRGGEIKDATTSDKGEEYRIARYAKGWSIDEQDIIDDRFDLLEEKPAQMARAAARLRPDLVYAHLLSNPVMGDGKPLFHADHGNILKIGESLNPELGQAALEAAKVQLAMMQEEGVTLDFVPTDLLLTPGLEFLAKQLIESPEIRGDGAANGTRNPAYNLVERVIPEARLANGVRDPKSQTFVAGHTGGFYVFDRNSLDFRVAFLAGTGRSPRVRSRRYQEQRYGIRYEVNLDIGVKAVTELPVLRSVPA